MFNFKMYKWVNNLITLSQWVGGGGERLQNPNIILRTKLCSLKQGHTILDNLIEMWWYHCLDLIYSLTMNAANNDHIIRDKLAVSSVLNISGIK
jgi:hypothetical protein